MIGTFDIELARALKWASTKFHFSDAVLFRKSPWGAVVRLEASMGQRAFLKLASRGNEARVLPSLSEALREVLPRVIAIKKSAGWILLADHGGSETDPKDTDALMVAIDCYAKKQALLVGHESLLRFLRRIAPAEQLFEKLFRCLTDMHCIAMPAALASSERRELLKRLSSRHAAAIALVGRSLTLPETFNHNDLHSGNIAKHKDGRVTIFDWEDAVLGPAGLSVATFTSFPRSGSPWSESTGDPRAMPNVNRSLLLTYASALAEAGYATSSVLHNALPGSLIWGALGRIVDFLPYIHEDDPACRSIIRRAMIADARAITSAIDHIDA